MTLVSRLRRSFAHALPVNGPHANIECELLLAGKKPVGWFDIYSPQQIEDNKRSEKKIKELHDQERLDQAVKDGKLKSADGYAHETEKIVRYYCQPEHENTMHALMMTQEKMYLLMQGEQPRELSLCEQISLASKGIYRYGTGLGYRKRDVMDWYLHKIFPDLPKISEKYGQAYRNHLLEECGINPQKFHEEWDNKPG